MTNLRELSTLTKLLNILYVEDDSSVRSIVERYLSKLFAKVVVANDGFEGLKAYNKEKFDIVITDLSMPHMNGLEMIEKIRKLSPEQLVLITTAYTDAKHMSNAIKLGVDGYVIKPFDYEQLNYELFKMCQKLSKFKEVLEYQTNLEKLVSDKTAELRSLMDIQKDNYEQTLLSFVNMVEQRDSYTAGHSQRVSLYCNLIAKEMGCNDEEILAVSRAGILHDIGKIATPDVVLLKPQALSELEYKLIKEHVRVGYEILVKIPMYHDLAEIVYDHHERCDGSGYPRGIKSEEIHPLAKIMMVADTFDAMTTNRIYKGRKDIPTALNEIKSLAGSQYNTDVVNAAFRALKDVAIDDEINQLPATAIEKERFAYFYKDRLTDLYNKTYLDVMLVQNGYEFIYENLHYLQLKHFSAYNKKNGWNEGDALLKKVANFLTLFAKPLLAFTVFGDDFVLLENGECDLKYLENEIKKLLDGTTVGFSIKSINLKEKVISFADDLEKL
ncbi:HD domain-containing phosphohydrolase [Sulfurimonas sp.]